ncbi:Adenosylmethionine decarboxylase [Rubrivivax sp. A210]|uniref:adenosylmethionine decarboxylase n=1 Tax=Rubrivivax sp. A210 TaxID=2772301 RepID=UPI0019183CBF|nr:adenosylmethionine decarboxylase [Rubrivivax sp. A210]CAD5373730.1 Adenosylmethionine decarboxylase [Rubrivivax sp. A210]
MEGLQLTADLRGCDEALPAMRDASALRALCVQAVAAAGLQAVGDLFHGFGDAAPAGGGGGVTGVVLLAESHLAVHTWPELGAVTLDVYVCNFGADNSQRADALLQALLRGFAPRSVTRNRLRRGAAP